MPQLVGQDGRLAYQTEGRLDKINKGHYKSYLSTITTNLKSLLDAEKETVKNASLTKPLSKSKVAGFLQMGVTGKEMMTVSEHANILQA